jgi:hypothetical protein
MEEVDHIVAPMEQEIPIAVLMVEKENTVARMEQIIQIVNSPQQQQLLLQDDQHLQYL